MSVPRLKLGWLIEAIRLNPEGYTFEDIVHDVHASQGIRDQDIEAFALVHFPKESKRLAFLQALNVNPSP